MAKRMNGKKKVVLPRKAPKALVGIDMRGKTRFKLVEADGVNFYRWVGPDRGCGFKGDEVEMSRFVFPEELASELGRKELWQVQALAPAAGGGRMICSTSYFGTEREAWAAVRQDAFAPFVSALRLTDDEVAAIAKAANAYAKKRTKSRPTEASA